MGEKRNAHKILVGKPERKRPLERPRRRRVDNIKMDLAEIGWGGVVVMKTMCNFRKIGTEFVNTIYSNFRFQSIILGRRLESWHS
jgi:hypothetical protein